MIISRSNVPLSRWVFPMAASLLLMLPVSVLAGGKGKAAQKPAAKQTAPTPEQIQKEYARLKAENKKKDKAQIDGWLKSVPRPEGPDTLDSDQIKMHAAHEWYLLTYPTGTMPSMPWDRARKHVDKKVKDAEPWPGPALSPSSPRWPSPWPSAPTARPPSC